MTAVPVMVPELLTGPRVFVMLKVVPLLPELLSPPIDRPAELESVTVTAPVLLAMRLAALVAPTVAPPVPEVSVNVVVDRLPVVDIVPVEPVASAMEVVPVRPGDAILMSPFVESREILAEAIWARPLALLMVLAAVTLTDPVVSVAAWPIVTEPVVELRLTVPEPAVPVTAALTLRLPPCEVRVTEPAVMAPELLRAPAVLTTVKELPPLDAV